MTDNERKYILEQIDVCLDKMKNSAFGVKYDPRGALISLKAAINAMQAQAVIPEAYDDDGEAWELEVDARLDRLEQRLMWLETVSNFGTSLKGKDIQKTTAYAVIRKLNAELAKKGYFVQRGRVPKKYFLKRFGAEE